MGTKQKSTKASLGTMNKYAVPFYEPPSRKTSAEIINEARLSIKGTNFLFIYFNVPFIFKTCNILFRIFNFKTQFIGHESQVTDNSYSTNLIKPLQTQRPFTPRDKERIFFGQKAGW